MACRRRGRVEVERLGCEQAVPAQHVVGCVGVVVDDRDVRELRQLAADLEDALEVPHVFDDARDRATVLDEVLHLLG